MATEVVTVGAAGDYPSLTAAFNAYQYWAPATKLQILQFQILDEQVAYASGNYPFGSVNETYYVEVTAAPGASWCDKKDQKLQWGVGARIAVSGAGAFHLQAYCRINRVQLQRVDTQQQPLFDNVQGNTVGCYIDKCCFFMQPGYPYTNPLVKIWYNYAVITNNVFVSKAISASFDFTLLQLLPSSVGFYDKFSVVGNTFIYDGQAQVTSGFNMVGIMVAPASLTGLEAPDPIVTPQLVDAGFLVSDNSFFCMNTAYQSFFTPIMDLYSATWSADSGNNATSRNFSSGGPTAGAIINLPPGPFITNAYNLGDAAFDARLKADFEATNPLLGRAVPASLYPYFSADCYYQPRDPSGTPRIGAQENVIFPGLVVSGDPILLHGDLTLVGSISIKAALSLVQQGAISFSGALALIGDVSAETKLTLEQLEPLVLSGILTMTGEVKAAIHYSAGLPPGWYVERVLESVPNPNFGSPYGQSYFTRWTYLGFDDVGTMLAASGAAEDCFNQLLSIAQSRSQQQPYDGD